MKASPLNGRETLLMLLMKLLPPSQLPSELQALPFTPERQRCEDRRVHPYLAHVFYSLMGEAGERRARGNTRVPHLYTAHAQALSRPAPLPTSRPPVFVSVRSSYKVLRGRPLWCGPCVPTTLSPERSSCFLLILRADGEKCRRSHEGVLGRRPVGEAGEGSGRFLHAAGHSQRVRAQGGRYRQVGELGVEVSQVCGTRLRNKEGDVRNLRPLFWNKVLTVTSMNTYH